MSANPRRVALLRATQGRRTEAVGYMLTISPTQLSTQYFLRLQVCASSWLGRRGAESALNAELSRGGGALLGQEASPILTPTLNDWCERETIERTKTHYGKRG